MRSAECGLGNRAATLKAPKAEDGMKHRNRFGDAAFDAISKADDAWMDRVIERARADGTPIDRQQLGWLMADLGEIVADALSHRCTVNLWGVILRPDGTAL